MKHRSKALSLLITLTVCVTSMVLVEVTSAQTMPKPTPPEFSLTFIPASENITHVDSFTGVKTFEIVDKSTIEVKIKNQPFEENINGVKYYLFYAVNVAGHFSQDPTDPRNWRYYYSFPWNYTKAPPQNSLEATEDSQYTTVFIGGDYSSHAQIDVHVGAMLMHDGQVKVYDYIGDLGHFEPGVVEGSISDPSIQTFTIPEHITSSNASSPPTTGSPNSTGNGGLISIPLATFAAIIIIFLLTIIVLLLLIFYKRPRNPVPSSKSLN